MGTRTALRVKISRSPLPGVMSFLTANAMLGTRMKALSARPVLLGSIKIPSKTKTASTVQPFRIHSRPASTSLTANATQGLPGQMGVPAWRVCWASSRGRQGTRRVRIVQKTLLQTRRVVFSATTVRITPLRLREVTTLRIANAMLDMLELDLNWNQYARVVSLERRL